MLKAVAREVTGEELKEVSVTVKFPGLQPQVFRAPVLVAHLPTKTQVDTHSAGFMPDDMLLLVNHIIDVLVVNANTLQRAVIHDFLELKRQEVLQKVVE